MVIIAQYKEFIYYTFQAKSSEEVIHTLLLVGSGLAISYIPSKCQVHAI